MTTTPAPDADTGDLPRALRLTFAYHGRQIRLVASRRVAVIAPPPVGASPASGASGHWCELRDAAGRRLYHRVLADPTPRGSEVFSERPGATIARVPRGDPQGEFDILVPDLPDARTFVFFGTPAHAVDESTPAQELVRADLDEWRKRADGMPPR